MIAEVVHLSKAELEAGLGEIRQAPKDKGSVTLIVRRPQKGERELLEEGELDFVEGLVGDNWLKRGSGSRPDGSADPEAQLTIMNVRAIALIAPDEARWPLAGDQVYVDLDLGGDNLPAGTQLALGSAIVEVTAVPHTGCKQFVQRFGAEAMKFVNSKVGRELNLRGINTKVIQPGTFRVGDIIKKV